MLPSQVSWVELYYSLCGYDGLDAYSDVLARWLRCHPEETRWLEAFSRRTDGSWPTANGDELCRLYAVSRVTSTLLLRFQTGRADGTDFPGPAIGVEDFRRFHEALGFWVPDPPSFHPFFHEITAVHQAAAAEAPIKIVARLWPPLMLGSMMFCRAGSIVSAGSAHAVKAVAEGSKLYWTFRRKDRPCNDLSHGWGSNSQWRTGFRRDYRSPLGFCYNVDARRSLNAAVGPVDGVEASAMIELVRNRGLIRTVLDDTDLFPYLYTLTEAP